MYHFHHFFNFRKYYFKNIQKNANMTAKSSSFFFFFFEIDKSIRQNVFANRKKNRDEKE